MVLVTIGVCINRLSEPNATIGRVKHAVEALTMKRRSQRGKPCTTNKNHVQEAIAIAKVKARARWVADIVDDEVYRTGVPSDGGIQRTRPNLSVWREAIGSTSDVERQRLQIGVLSGGHGEHTGLGVQSGTRQGLVCLDRVCECHIEVNRASNS